MSLIAGKVRDTRFSLKLTQSEFATKLGVPLRTYQEWEQGRRTPSGPSARLLSMVMDKPELLNHIQFTNIHQNKSGSIDPISVQMTLLHVLSEVLERAPQARSLFEERVEVGSAFDGTDIAVRASNDKTYLSITGILNTALARLGAPVIYKTYFNNTKEQDVFDPNDASTHSKYKIGFTPAIRTVLELQGPMIVAVFPGIVTKEDLDLLGVGHVFSPLPTQTYPVENVATWLSDENKLMVVECGLIRLRKLHDSGLVFNVIYPNAVFKTNVIESLRSRNTPSLLQYIEESFDELIQAFGTAKAMRTELVKNLDVHQALLTTINSARYIK